MSEQRKRRSPTRRAPPRGGAELKRATEALRESEERFRKIFENAVIGFYRTTPDGRVLLANPAIVRMLGYGSFAELATRDLEAETDSEYPRAAFRERIEREGVISGLEATWRRRDGSRLHLRESARVIRDAAGKPLYYEGTVEDISDRKLAEAALRESEERFRRLSEAAFEGIAITHEGRIIDANRRLAEMMGCRPQDLIGRQALDFVAPEERELVGARLRSDSNESYEHLARRVDGSTFPAEIHAGSMPAAGRTLRVTTILDITERKRAQEELELLKRSVDLASDAAFWHNADGRFVYVNDAACAALGYTREELLRMRIFDVSPRAGGGRLEEIWRQAKAEKTIRLETVHRRRDGSTFPVEIVATYVKLGAREHVCGFARDITERRRAEAAIRERELLFRTLTETTGVGILIVQDGVYTYANPAAERLTGYTAAELATTGFLDLVHPDSRELVRERSAARLAGAQDVPTQYEVKGLVKGGATRWFGLTSGMTSLGGTPALVATLTDVTEERRLREVQTALYQISEAAQTAGSLDALYRSIHAVIGRFMEARNFYISLYDPSRNELRFPYFVDEVDPPPEPFPPGRGMTSYVFRTGRPLLATPEVLADLEARGEIEPLGAPSLDWLGVPLKAQDRVIGVLAVQSYSGAVRYGEAEEEILAYVSTQVAQAIERKRAEEALRESEQFARALINATSDNVILIDVGGKVLAVNAEVAESLGTTPEALAGADFFAQFEPAVGAVRRAYAEEVVRTGKPARLEDQRRGRWFDSRFYPLFDASGAVSRVAIFASDTTDARRAEEALRESQKMHAIGQLAGGVAHDFNNLLQALLGTVELLRANSGDGSRLSARGLDELEADVKRGAALTRQLLLFARREVARLERLDVNLVVRDTSALLRRLLPENIRIDLTPAAEALPVDADRGQLEQVLVNLAVNAADAMPRGGVLAIRTSRRSDDTVALEIEDTGSGIPEEIRARIFEPFFTTKGSDKGVGLGLAVVHGIVSQHHGRIEVASRVGAGSTFRVILPRQGSGAHPVAAPDAPAAAAARATAGERVLLVEDEGEARQVVAEILRLLGYEVVALATGEDAAALADGSPFDVLLTDLLLPGMHGGELANRLWRRWPGLRVIVMSGYAEDDTLRRWVSERAVRFLQKPFGMETLAREIRDALDQPAT